METDIQKIEYEDIKDDQNYKLLVLCGDCRNELNSTVKMTGKELKQHWGQLVTSSGLATGGCSKGCRATFSDCNINTDLVIVETE